MVFSLFKKLKKKISSKKKVRKTSKKKAVKKRQAIKSKRPVAKKQIRKKSKAKRAVKGKSRLAKVSRPQVPGQFIGDITHYFSKVGAAVLIVNNGELRITDKIMIVGHTTNFEQIITSMQINRQPIQVAKKGDEIGLAVKSRVRQGDKLYKIT
jgi:putative protease